MVPRPPKPPADPGVRLQLVREQTASHGWHRWVWRIQVGRRAIGTACLEQLDPLRVDFGVAITNPADRGRGSGTAATRLVLAYAFTTLGLPHVGLTVRAGNRRAIACYRRCGFQVVARLRDRRTTRYRMLCLNPTVAQPTPLQRRLLLDRSLFRGRCLQFRQADLAFLGIAPGDPVAIEAAGDQVILQPVPPTPPEQHAVPVTLSVDAQAALQLTAATLGLSVGAIVVALVEAAAAAAPTRSSATEPL